MDLLRTPRALGFLGVPLAAATVWATFNSAKLGIPANHASLVMIVAIPLAVWLVYAATAEPPAARTTAATALGKLAIDPPDAYRDQPPTRVDLARIDALSPTLAHTLERVGTGEILALYRLKRDAATLAVVGANAMGTSDFVSVLLVLEQTAPSFVARPAVHAEPAGDRHVAFPKDPRFNERYLVEADGGVDTAKAVRKLLTTELRDALLEDGRIWLHVHGKTAALTLFGTFDPGAVHHLVEIADAFYAAYGTGGSESSLFAPDEAAAPKKKKKAKAKSAAPAAED